MSTTKGTHRILTLAAAALAGCAAAAGGEPACAAFAPFNPGEYRRPYGPNAPWNVPVKGLARHPESGKYARLLYREATADRPGNFNLTFTDYTYPVYVTTDARGSYPVKTRWKTNIDGTEIPWNPDWRAPGGTDSQIILLDPEQGLEWDLWQVTFRRDVIHATNGNLVEEGEDRGKEPKPGNYWTKEDGFAPSRGAGIPYLAMLVRPEEIMQGEIRHALSMPIKNTDGKTFVRPATKLEYPDRPAGIPEGLRFALDLTEEEIADWAARLPAGLPPETRYSAGVIARALRDYGWFVTDTSGGAHFQFEERLTAGGKWDALGLHEFEHDGKKYPRDLLDGLITEEAVYALVPSDQYRGAPEAPTGGADAGDSERGPDPRAEDPPAGPTAAGAGPRYGAP